MAESAARPTGTAPRSQPSVAAVLVTRNPGEWFEDVLAALAAQDYPAMQVLVVDVASVHDPTEQVHAHLPAAAIVHMRENAGYGAAANVAQREVRGADFLLLLHDDIALAPDAVGLLVAEAVRSNAGICGPKLVDWDNPKLLRHVGASVDKTGVQAPHAEPSELDQEQHDRVRDVFLVAGGAVLVRADLFETIGGFDPAIDFLGDDLDLCWRAQVAGSRVLIVPDAVGRHREALAERRPDIRRRRLLTRHRVRSMLVCYGWLHLVRVLPQAAVLSLGEMVSALVLGRFSQARDVVGGVLWNLRRLPDVTRAHRRTQSRRRVRDSEIRRLQVHGSARLTAFFRDQIGEDARLADLATRSRAFAGSVTSGARRTSTLMWAVIGVALVVGSRHLITRGVPTIADFAAFPSAGALLGTYWGGWREVGLGIDGVGPMAGGMLGMAGYGLLGATALLRQVLILGLLPLGSIGAWRLTRPLGSRRAGMAAAVGYVLVPLGINVVARGDWSTLLILATGPWFVLRLARLSRLAPYGPIGGEPGPGASGRSFLHQVVTLGLLVAVVATFAPAIVLLVPGMAVALLVGGLFAGSLVPSVRAVVGAALATALGVVLHLPWALQLRSPEAAWDLIVGAQPASRPGDLADLVRFQTGPWGESWLVLAGLVVAAVPLLLARGWRMAWTARAWALILAGIGAAWAAGQGWFDVDVPATATLLVPAAIGVSFAAALAVVAYEEDVAGRAFGWRQLTGAAAIVAFAAWALPGAAAVLPGDWDMPRTDWRQALGFLDLDETVEEGSYRVAWVGADEILPMAGWPVESGLVVGSSVDGSGDVRDAFVIPDDRGGERLAEVLDDGMSGRTARLGRLMVPMGVRYVVVLEKATPSFDDGLDRPVGDEVEEALASQLDLRRVAADPGALVYENLAWVPRRAVIESGEVPEEATTGMLAATRPPDGLPVLEERVSAREQRGVIESGTVLMADADGENWSLDVGDGEQPRRPAYGWAQAFEVESGGSAVLRHDRPTSTLLLLVGQLILWLVVLRIATAEPGRRRARRPERPRRAWRRHRHEKEATT